MKKAKNFSNRLMAMLLSAAMILAPVLQSMPVYAAEAGSAAKDIGTLPEAVEMGSIVSGSGASDEVFHEMVRETGTGDADDAKLLGDLKGAFFAASASDFSIVGGWNESIYAEIAGVKAADVTEVSWSGAMTGSLAGDDLTYLVRDKGSNVRIDIPGLKAGTYTLTVKVGGSTLTKSSIEVQAYDRSGFAHFNYTEGVGAYKDDGTLKENAIVLYVTDENKNTVSLSCNGITVTGIGNILNSVGQDSGNGQTNKGGKPNTNQGIIKELAKAGRPLVVRFIGCVSETGLYQKGSYSAADAGLIEGLTDYNSIDNGGSDGDNGHMARIYSGKDITLEGIGYDAVIDGWGFHYMAQSSDPDYGKSFEVRNLTFINTPEDAIGMEGVQVSDKVTSDLSASVERCWVHNNEFYCPVITSPAESDKNEGDGSVDFKRGQYFTCSYNYFDSCHKTNLIGSASTSLQFNLSYHHNYWYMCQSRGPLARNANIHMYNNIVDMQTTYAQNARANSYIFSEYNLFYASKNPQDTSGEGNGVIKSYNDSIASVISMANPATVVQNKTDYVANNCQFSARGIKYDKFDTDAALSYIPSNNYKLDTDFTELRKVVASQTGVQAQNPKLPGEISASEYSVVPKDATINTFDSLPQNLTPGKISKKPYVFTVNGAFNVEVAYGSAAAPGVLVNEAGENLLTGDGGLVNLPAGTYMIQANNFQPGDPQKGTTVSFKDITISTLNIEQNDPNAHYHKWVLDSSKSIAATCTEAGKNVYICEADKDGGNCGETKEESVAALGHSWSDWKVDKEATETEAGQKSRSCTRGCGATDTAVIPAGTTGTGGGGNSGEGTGGTPIGTEKITHSVPESGKSSAYFAITGSINNSEGTSASYNGETFTGKGLKMESSTSIQFTTTTKAKLVLLFDAGSVKKTNVDGKGIAAVNGVIEVDIEAGEHSVTKNNTSVNLYAIIVIPEGGGSGEGGGDNEVIEYTVTIDLADGSAVTTLIVDAGKSITAEQLPTPTREGYSFTGWVDGSNKPITLPYKPTANVTIKAVWEKEIVIDPDALYNMYLTSLDIPTGTYTSDFQKNGFTVKAGEGADQSVSVDVGSKKTIGGKDYTGRLKTGGIGTKDYRSIKFTTKDAATLTMACVVATTGDICTLGVATLNENGEFVEITEGITVDGKTASVITLSGSAGNLVTVNLPAADTYYIYSKGSSEGKSGGVNFYAINVTYAGGVDPVFCTVTFNSMGGLSVESQKVQAGDACVEPAGTLKSGYTFDGWYADYECTKKYDFSTPVKSNITLYAKWLAGEPDGEYLVLDMKDLPARDYSESFSRNGFTFKATSAKNLSVDASAVTVEDVDYTKRLKLNGTGSTSDRNLSFTIEASATLTLVAASGSSGTARALKVTNGTTTYDIAGIDGAAKYTQELTAGTWQIYAAKDGVNIYYISVKGEGVKAQYIITIDRQDGTEAVVKTVVEGTQLTETDLPSALTRDGYTFQGWVDEDGSAITAPYTPTKNMTIKATWQKNHEDPKPGPGTGDGEDPKPGPGTGDGEDPKPGPGTGDGEDPKPGPGTGDGEDHIGLEIELAEPGEEYVYTGSTVKPEIIVTNNGELLTEGVDYTVKYSNNIKAADKTAKNAPKITVSGKGNLTGSTYTTFTIGQKSLEDEDVVKGDIVVAKGSKATPVLVYRDVKLGTKDYEFAVKEDAKKKFTEDGTIVLNGKGNFTGSVTLDVTAVDKADLKKFTVEVGKEVLTYNGDKQHPAITVKDSKSKEVLDETKYVIVYGGDETSAGTQKFTVIGMNGYTGTVAKSYSIKPLAVTDPSAFEVQGVEKSYTFRSAGVTLEDVKVYYGEEKELLTAGKDYKVTYSNNKKVSGKSGAKYTITFLGNYKGSKAVSGTFEITAAPLDNDTDGLKIVSADKTYKKPGQYKSAPYVSIDGVLLKGSDYKVEYYLDKAMEIPMGGKNKVTVEEGADSATVYVKITGKGNYAPADENTYATMSYEVCKVGTNQADLSKARVTFVDKDGKKLTKAEYTGLEVEPAVKVEIKDGKNWQVVDDDQYEVTYVNNVSKGKATAVITAVGTDCVSSKTATFNIVARNLKNQTALWDNLFKMFGE